MSPARAAEPIKLKSANYLPTTHPMSVLGAWFCDEIKKRTNGRVEITYYPGGTLLSPVKMYDGVVTGIADMGMSHISYTRGRFPVTEVFDNPLGFPNGWVSTPGRVGLLREVPAQGVERGSPPLYQHLGPPADPHGQQGHQDPR